jgi:predicted ATPase
MLGFSERAVETARQGLREAIEQDHPITTAYVLALLVFIYLQTADWLSAEDLIDRLMSHSSKHGLRTYHRSAAGWQGCLTILRGDPSVGIEQLQHALADLRSDGYELYRGVFAGVLAEGLAKTGRAELARETIRETIIWAVAHERSDDLPELHRIEGDILIAMSPPNRREAEACFSKSLELARQQAALSLELRAGMRLARIWSENNRAQDALNLLGSIYDRFSEGFQTPDLIAASSLLNVLRSPGLNTSLSI